MKSTVLVALLAVAGWYGYSQHHGGPDIPVAVATRAIAQPAPDNRFKCDGRTHCSQMTSCAEATYFLQHCPGTTMDGDNDGVPCERQWCR
jgi:hypothetical protein